MWPGVLESATAKDVAMKALLVSGVVAASLLAVVLIGGTRGGGPTQR